MAERKRQIAQLQFVSCVMVFILANVCYVKSADISYDCNYILDTNLTFDSDGGAVRKQFIKLQCLGENSTEELSTSGLDFGNQSIAWYRLGLDGPQLVDEGEWVVSERDLGVTFVCAEENDDGNLEVLCDVTPLEIVVAVEVKQSLFTKDMMTFVCDQRGMPGTVAYKWYVNDVPIGRGSRSGDHEYEFYSDSVVKITGLTAKDEGMLVTCEVISSNGIRANASIPYSLEAAEKVSGGLTTDKMFLFGLLFAGGAPIVFAVFALACLAVHGRKKEVIEEEPKLTVEEQDMVDIPKRNSLLRSNSNDVPSDLSSSGGVYRSPSTRSTKEKLGRLSQLVLPPIEGESNSRVSQHIYDEAPHFATSELALSRGGKHSSTLPAKTYTSRSSLYRLSADYADLVHSPASGNYENFRLHNTSNSKPMVVVHERNGHVNSTLPPAMKL